MPCTPPKARALLKASKARPRRNKLGLFYIQLTYEQEPTNQVLVLGIDPGSAFEGYSVVGTQDTVLNLMVEAPTHVKGAVKTRRTMRRARRYRKWRRPARHHNRLARKQRLPPSTRSRWEAKARVVAHLQQILPLSDVVVEDVQAVTRPGQGAGGIRPSVRCRSAKSMCIGCCERGRSACICGKAGRPKRCGTGTRSRRRAARLSRSLVRMRWMPGCWRPASVGR
jgi:hypothetical protein